MKFTNYAVVMLLLLFTVSSCEEQELVPDNGGDNLATINEPGAYTPKPSNIPSKAPKAVICSYFANNGGIPGFAFSTCGWSWSGSYGPTPQSVIDMLNAQQFSRNTSNLYIRIRYWYDTSGTIYEIPFSQFNSSIKNDFITFYKSVDDNGSMLVPNYLNPSGNATETYHVHKQAFLDTFQNWLYRTKDTAPNNYNYIVNNQQVFSDVFWMLADIHLGADAADGVYMEIPYGIYSPNADIRCLSNRANYLQTAAGLTLMQQLGSGAISNQQFLNALPTCN